MGFFPEFPPDPRLMALAQQGMAPPWGEFDPRMAPQMPMTPPQGFPEPMMPVLEVPTSFAPQGGGAGFLDALAMGLADLPMPQVSPRAGAGEQFLAGLVGGAARGFAGGRMRQMGRKEALEESMRKAAAERNRLNLEATREAQKAASAAGRELALYRSKKAIDQQYAEPKAGAKTPEQIEADARAASRGRIQAYRDLGLTPPGQATIEDEDALDSAVDAVVSGEADLTNFPIRDRAEIANRIKQRGLKITPKKARDAMNNLSAALEIVDHIEMLSRSVNTGGSGLGRFVTGSSRLGQSVSQSNPDVNAFQAATEGFLATIARAAGERGVLTDQDVARARKLLPTIWTSRAVAQRNLSDLRSLLERIGARAVRTYSQPAGSAPPARGDIPPGRGGARPSLDSLVRP
jgi:hypothetical protein